MAWLIGLTALLWPVVCFAPPSPDPGATDRHDLSALYRRPSPEWPRAWVDAGIPFVELGTPPPPSRPTTRQAAQARLGEALFRDPRLSATGEVACSSCHDPGAGWSVTTPTAVGVNGHRGRRNPPDLRQVRAHRHGGWDGRGENLASQSLAPLTDPREMGHADLASVLARLASLPGTAPAFGQLYGPGPPTAAALGEVLATWLEQAGRRDPPSRFARFVGGEVDALSDQEIRGLHLFRTRARCANCHFGPWLSDGRFHNLLISSFGEPARDDGRYGVTSRPADVGAFRTPSLHRVAESPPYMHSGLFATLEGVIRLYARGGGEVWARNATEAAAPLHPHAARPSPQLKAVDLGDDEIAALAAFLRAL